MIFFIIRSKIKKSMDLKHKSPYNKVARAVKISKILLS